MELFNFLWDNSTIVAAALTTVAGTLGVNKVLGRISGIGKASSKIAQIVKEINDLIVAVTEALKPDKDGKVRISPEELEKIKKEIAEVSGALKYLD